MRPIRPEDEPEMVRFHQSLSERSVRFRYVLLAFDSCRYDSMAAAWPALAVLGACFAWAIDNNLTRKAALADATVIASIKGLDRRAHV